MHDQDIAGEVALLMAERAITRTIYDYGVHLDYGDRAAWQDLFVPDGRYELHYRPGMTSYPYGNPQRDGDRLIYDGHVMLAGFAADHTHIPHRYHKHFVADLRIDIDGDRASASSYFARMDASEDGVRVIAAGRYLDDLLRCEDGRWRFVRRVAEIEMKA